MAGLSPAEIISQSFYAWEIRGRGWMLADYEVALEPPYRPFFILPELNLAVTTAEDDGKRHTLLSRAITGVKSLLAKGAEEENAIAPYQEEPPYPGEECGAPVSFAIRVPPEVRANTEAHASLLLSLAESRHPVAFELIGRNREVMIQVVCASDDATLVKDAINGYVPEAVVAQGDDLLFDAWRLSPCVLLVDFGLANEFFLPLEGSRSLRVDPQIAFVSALAQAEEGEAVCLQVLFEGVRNPWASGIRSALVDPHGDPVFADAPEFIPLSKEKTQSPIVAAVIRVGACAHSEERALHLVQGVASGFVHLARPGSNELLPLENDGYDDVLHEESFLERTSYRTGMLLSVDELFGLVHLPDASVRHAALLRVDRHTKALPAIATGDGIVLGENVHHGVTAIATLPDQARLTHTHVIGASGLGKSTLLLHLVLQDIERGQGVAVLDPHGDLVDDIVNRIPEGRCGDVVLFDPSDRDYPIGFNVLSASTDTERTLIASDLVAVFRRLSTSWGDSMNTVLANAVLAMLESPQGGTLVDLRRFLVEDEVRKDYLSATLDPHVRYFWEKEYRLIGGRSIGPILTRLDAFLRPTLVRHIVGQKNGKLDIGAVVREKKILLAKLGHGEIGEENAHLLGSILVSKLHHVALARQRIPKGERHPFFLFIDEFQHFVTPSMAALLSEARKYGVGLTLAHQTLAQLRASPEVESALLGNAFTRIMFRLAAGDAGKMADGLSSFDADDLLTLSTGEAIVRMGSAENDFNVRVRPPSEIRADALLRRREIVAASRARYATPVEEVRGALEIPSAPTVAERVTPAPPRSSLPSAPPVPASPASAALVSPTAAPATLPTIKAAPPIPSAPALLGRGGKEHKYLQHLVKRLAEERGFHAVIEHPVGDGESVDVVLRREQSVIACEISVTTDVEHEIENVRKCLGGSFTHVFVVVQEKRRRDQLAKRVTSLESTIPVAVLSPEEIVDSLDQFGQAAATETVVRGYKVKVNRQALSPKELSGKRAAIAEVIAKAMKRKRDDG